MRWIVNGRGGGGDITSDMISDASVIGRAILTAATAAQERSILGLGNAATRNVGTGANDVAAGNAVSGGVQPIVSATEIFYDTPNDSVGLSLFLRVKDDASTSYWSGTIYVFFSETTGLIDPVTMSLSGDADLIGSAFVSGSPGSRRIHIPFSETVSGAVQVVQI